jgi:hypothetical protein
MFLSSYLFIINRLFVSDYRVSRASSCYPRVVRTRCHASFARVTPLPESEALPSVGLFAECLLSGTRQRRLCRVPHSVKLDTRQSVLCRVLNTRHRTTLGKDNFAECQTLGKGGSRQTAVSGRQSLPSVSRWLSAKRFCTECHIVGTRQSILCRVSSQDTRQSIFYFFYFVSQNFCGMFLHYVDLHVSFVDNFNRVFNR